MRMKTVLFVCTANIARSPMVEALFNKKIHDMGLEGQYQAKSAGTWTMDGIPAPPDGQQVMRDRGLDTSTHLSRAINREIIENADLILTMEAGHKEALQIEFPSYRIMIFLLSEMVDSEMDIDDPYKRGLEKFEETAQELEYILENGIDKILQIASRGD